MLREKLALLLLFALPLLSSDFTKFFAFDLGLGCHVIVLTMNFFPLTIRIISFLLFQVYAKA